jgi:hypothetical protein
MFGRFSSGCRTTGWWWHVDKKLAAERIRARLERRIAAFLGCEVGDLPRMKIGTLVHTSFLLWGDSEELGGFHSTMAGVLQILGAELVWDVEAKVEEVETPKAVLVN